MTSHSKITTISLGWGVQSWGLAAMVAKGVLPPVNYVIHADTGHERSETYTFARAQSVWLRAAGIDVITVKGGRPMMGTIPPGRPYTSLPAFTRKESGEQSGMLRRQCTGDLKIQPIRRFLRARMHERKIKVLPGAVEQWLGITLDEIQRVKPSWTKYIKLRYPFIEMFDPPMTRQTVVNWLKDNDLPVPVKSSCVFCPYHDRATWREIKANTHDWAIAVALDQNIRHARAGYLCYLTSDRKPLEEVDFSPKDDGGQLSLWDEECEGMCFL